MARNRKELLPGTYQMRMEYLPGSTQPYGVWNGGALSGLRLPGDGEHYYTIHVGPDRCELVTMGDGPDGCGVVIGREDIRGRTHVLTETVGRIDLRLRPAGAGLRKKLSELRAFLTQLPGQQVTKLLG